MKRYMIISLVLAALGIPVASADSYDAATNRLTIDSVQVGSTIYTNVVITVGTVISVGGSLPAGYVLQGGLTWSPPSSTIYQYAAADAYCRNAAFNGLTGWRLPTLAELSGITSQPTALLTLPNVGQYAIATGGLYASGALTGMGWPAKYIWSSTATTSAASENFPGYWGVFVADMTDPRYPFRAGNVVNSGPMDDGNVTCVR